MASSATFTNDAVLAGGMSEFTQRNLDQYETIGTFNGAAATATVHVPFVKLRLSAFKAVPIGTTTLSDSPVIQLLHESDTSATLKTGVTAALPADTGLGSGFLATIARPASATATANLQVALQFGGVTG